MAESGDDKPMYGPWTRVERPRKRGQRCRIIGNPGKDTKHDHKKKTCKELMREKTERENSRRTGGDQKDGQEREGTGEKRDEGASRERKEK